MEEMKIIENNLKECDALIGRLLEEIKGRKNVLFIDDLTNSVAKLMNARAAYTNVLIY
ncbi:MAG: hypothetical protein IJQ26_06785 [Lachnospiraceae bacterium]|nr:hypothetical protein [Lachnospiraceae bacterium]